MTFDIDESSSSELARSASALTPELRAHIAREWAGAAQLEHASIASFGRFALQLLALGAPTELVAGAHRAALDEIRHAQLCFGLASAYAHEPLAPAALPIDARALASVDVHAVVRAAVIEGCVGGTLAAVEAKHACALAEPHAVKHVLRAIAREESEHAALAYRFVSWAVRRHGASVRTAVASAFESALCRQRSLDLPPRAANARVLAAHGRLCARERHVLLLRALDELIAPLAHELLSPPSAAVS